MNAAMLPPQLSASLVGLVTKNASIWLNTSSNLVAPSDHCFARPALPEECQPAFLRYDLKLNRSDTP
jgi:hypothetical protein